MDKKREKQINIKTKLTNKWFYSFIVLISLILIGIGVYALNPGVIPTPGHNYTELATCKANEVLKMNSVGTAWECGVALTQEYADLNYKDPPGQWSCTLRTSSGSGTSSASCVSPEKVITGGCRSTSSSCDGYLYGYPKSDGWTCYCLSSSVCGTVSSFAYCCK